MLLLTGATGSIGLELCRLLGQAPIAARALCRKPEQTQLFRTMGLETALGDCDNPASLRQAMAGCERLFLLSPPLPQQAQWQRNAIDQAEAAGIQHILKVSTADSNLTSAVPWAKAQAESDHYLRSCPLNWTILRPTGFMQNLLESAPAIARGVFPHVTGAGPVSYIDARDVALVAKHLLVAPGHAGATYYLTGPEALAAQDIAARLTTGLGREIRAVQQTVEELRGRLQTAGLSDWLIAAVLAQFDVIARGHAIDVTGEVQRLTGQPPRSLLQFIRDNQTYFEGGAAA